MSNTIQPKLFGQQLRGNHWSTRGLVGFWRFIEAGNLVDESLFRNHGTINGATWVGQGLDFDRVTSDYVQVPSNLGITGPPFTVIAWFKCDVLPSTTGDEYTIFSHNDQRAGSSLDWWRCRIDATDDKLNYNAREGAFDAATAAKSAIAITAGKWHQMATVEVADNLRHVYLDAGNRGTATGSDPPLDPASHVFDIGYNEAGLQDAFLGQIAQVLVYNRALSRSEIQDLYINPNLLMQEPIWMYHQTAAPSAGLAGIYYRTLLQGVV